MKAYLLFFFMLTAVITATDPLRPKFTNAPPKIDGVLDDEIWKTAPSVTGFKTFIPDFGKDQSEKTVVYMCYDKENIYFAYKCYDSEPDKIKATMTNRDNTRPDDWICLNLDTFNDQQSLCAFYVNPFGIQSDSKMVGDSEDTGIDFVWYSAGKIDSDGYTIEMQIPLKSIRYANTNPVEMAVFFERRISRKAEQGAYPPMDPAKGYAFTTQLKPMFYENVEHYTLFEIMPAVTFNQQSAHENGSLGIKDIRRDFGFNMKYGITSDLILDGAYNPDFSQIESDAGQVDINLRYGLYFPEKRPFFLEGRENFVFGGTGQSEADPVVSLVHTRTIVDPLIGLKLTGKLSSRGTLSALYAMDEKIQSPADRGKYAHFPIVRFKYALNDDSYIGLLAASREDLVETDIPVRAESDSYNRLGGIDGLIRVSKSGMIDFGGTLSMSKNPFADETLYGHNLSLKYGYGTRDLDYFVNVKNVSEDFRADMGYLTRTGVFIASGLLRPKFYPESDFFRRIDLEIFSAQTRDAFFGMWETYNTVSLLTYLPGSFQFKVKYSLGTEIFLGERFNTGGIQAQFVGWLHKTFYLSLLYRRLDAIYYSNSPFQGYSNLVSAGVIYQPSDKLNANVTFTYSDFTKDSDGSLIYNYPIVRTKVSYQLNQYLFLRGILEYNDYRERMLADFLVSFTYIPGTVIHVGYGSMFERVEWDGANYRPANNFLETRRGLFFKASYLYRL